MTELALGIVQMEGSFLNCANGVLGIGENGVLVIVLMVVTTMRMCCAVKM